MPGLTDLAVRQQRTMGPLLVLAVLFGLIGLPLAVWLDLRSLSERLLRLQAERDQRHHRRHAGVLRQRRRRARAAGATAR